MESAHGQQWMPLRHVEPSAKYSGIKHLQSAIYKNDVIEACRLITQLAKQRAKIQLIPKYPPPKPEISVTVRLEDKNMSRGQLVLRLSPSTSISELKDKMLYERGIPPELQCWIINNDIMKDDRKSLASCGIEQDGQTIHLYVLSGLLGASANSLRKKYEHIWEGPEVTSTPDMTRPPTRMGQPPLMSMPLPQATASTSRFQPLAPPLMSLGAAPSPPKPPPVGWACPVCTFINVPSRPGCEMCSETRPENYKIPDTFEIPPHEQARLAREATDLRYPHLTNNEQEEIRAALRDPITARAPPAARPVPGFSSTTRMGAAANIPPSAETSWECPRCTFINAAVRPGCEICSAARPDNGMDVDDEQRQFAIFRNALVNYMIDNDADGNAASVNQRSESQA